MSSVQGAIAPPTIATKLYIPRRRRGLVTRPRLGERLRPGADSRLTLVSAPAGFGKTTLLTEWLGQSPSEDRRVAWLSLDRADHEPATFWTYVVTALRAAVPGISPDVLDLIASAPLPTELLVTTLLNELAGSDAGDVWLVLDDYHLADGGDIRDGMALLLERLPRQMHVVISTRADPDLPLPRWRVRGELVEIRAADLRFTADEAAAYLNEVAGLGLTDHDVTALGERTEGWIAALQLAALSIKGRADVGGFIARFAGTDRYVVDYLVEEVLAHQPDSIRDFLLCSAVLDRLTGSLCDAVTGRDDGYQTLITLERANLFLVPLDDRREWFRYHHLFADVLRARLLGEQPDRVPLLHQRASHWYERQDLMEDAVRHALAGRDFDRAADLVERAVPALRLRRQDRLLQDWLTSLPDDTIRRRPVLGVFYGHLLLASGDLDAVAARLDDAELALTAAGDESTDRKSDSEELRTLPATIAVFRASIAQARGDEPGTTEQARRALALAGPTDHLARGGAAGFLGLAAWARGEVTTALTTFTQAVSSLHAAGALIDELSSTVILGDLWLAAGRPGRARRLYRDALGVAQTHGEKVVRATAELLVGLSEIDLEAGDLDTTRRHLERAGTLAERAPMTESRFRWFVAMSRLADAEGDPRQAIALLDQAERLYQPGYFPDVRPIAAMKARVRIRAGELAPAADWADERGVSAAADADYLHAFDQLTVVRLVLARSRANHDAGSLDGAVKLLGRMATAAESSGRARDLLEIRTLQALTLDALGDRSEALRTLMEAWANAPEPDHYVRLFLDEGEPMVELLRAAAAVDDTTGRARRLLDLAFVRESTGGPGPRPTGASPAELSTRELQVLRLLDSELTGPEMARMLFVSQNTLRTHTKHIFTKLGVGNRRAAVRRAHELGLL